MRNNHIEFVIVGPQKAATTWIYEYLKSLPNICFPAKVKETFFFDKYYCKGLDWYFWHFKNCKPDTKWAEVAPSYFNNPETPARLYNFNKTMKILITLRNPYDPHILDSSFYATHSRRWLSYFGNNVSFVFHDDLVESPKKYIEKVCNYLDIPYVELNEFFDKKVNPNEMSRHNMIAKWSSTFAHWLRSHRMYDVINFFKVLGVKDLVFSGGGLPNGLSESDYQIMKDKFEQEITLLEPIVGRDLSCWRYPFGVSGQMSSALATT